MFSKCFLQVSHIGYFLIIHTDNYVIDFDISSGSRTILYDFRNPHSFYNTQFFSFICQCLTGFINRLTVVHQTATDRATTNTEQCTLYCSVLFQVGNYLRHNAGRDSETISCISTCRRRKHRIDTYQFTFGIYQRTATIPLIDSSIRLDE